MRKYTRMTSLGLAFCLSLGWVLFAQAQSEKNFAKENYDKKEYEIPMRDGITLFTAVYTPKDKSRQYPILLKRTCYSIRPYGEDKFPRVLGPSKFLMEDKYIFVYQDVRGRYMSEGLFDNMRPNVPGNGKKQRVDESSDTYDTIEWLLKNIDENNGKVGMWGISYPGFYTAAAIPDAHPALKASSPQAPVSDFYFDDFHHNGAFIQGYLKAFPVFGYQKNGKTTKPWYGKYIISEDIPDGYAFNLELGPLSNVAKYYKSNNFFWHQVVRHPNYDEFWQARSILPHLKEVKPAVMTVGGWFDAEDLYGPLNIYKTIERNTQGFNMLVMGPWSHGDWARERGIQAVNHIYFGDSISTFYQKEIERPFFHHFLKDGEKPDLPEAMLFDTGKNEWKRFNVWPPRDAQGITLTFKENGVLAINEKPDASQVFEYVSDPQKPVPYRSVTEGLVFTPRPFMTDDQRHASMRPDVLTFQTAPLEKDMTLNGEIMAKLRVAISGTDADFVIKLIDVLPNDHPDFEHNPKNIKMGGYQMLVRSEVMRGRFREGFVYPKPFESNKVTPVDFKLQDVLHTFKKGHRIMIQVHSTWFPYIDRNPQKYVKNIFEARAEDFQKATIKIYGSSVIEVGDQKRLGAAPSGGK